MKIKKKIGEKRLKDLLFCFIVLIYPIIHFAVFTVAMNISTIKNAFYAENMYGEMSFVGLKNFKDVFVMFTGEKATAGFISEHALPNVMWLMVLCLFINMPITLLFSFMVTRQIKGYTFFRIALFIPAVLPAVVLCLCFKLAVDYNYGIITELIRTIGLGKMIPTQGIFGHEDTAWTWIMIFSVWTGVSGNFIYFCSSMSRVPQELIESAKIDGCSEAKLFLKFFLPLIWSTVTTMMITYLGSNFAWYMPSLMLAGSDGNPNGTTSTIGLIVIQLTKSGANNGFVSALATIVGIFGGAFIVGLRYLFEKLVPEVEY